MKIRIVILIPAILLLGAAGAAFVVQSGIYNIAATEQHTQPTYWLMHYAMRRSASNRSEGIKVPDLSDTARIRNGFVYYRDHCVQCHGAPGVPPDPFGLGLRPAPANLVSAAREWPPAEIYWVVRHGIKMTGMPAWAYRLSDREIWDVVAFVMHMPALSPQDYADMDSREPQRPKGRTVAAAASSPVTNGNADTGRHTIQQYMCITCHRIPGVVGADSDVGPTLAGIGTRKYLAGVLPNTPENMVRWLKNPQQVDPLSAMPNLGVSEQDAHDIAAYLYTLKEPD